jgi:hypothetical protein
MKEDPMRSSVFAIATAALLAFPVVAFSQTVEVGPRGVDVEGMHQGRSAALPECREMRKACLNKDELGEQGQGNCERYRRHCQDE